MARSGAAKEVKYVWSASTLLGLLLVAQQTEAAQCLVGPIAAEGGSALGFIRSLGDADARGVRFIGADNGLFRLGPDRRLTRVATEPRNIRGFVLVSDADARGNRLALSTANFVFRLGPNGSLDEVESSDGDYPTSIISISDADASGARVVWATNGLFRFSARGRLARIQTDDSIGTIFIRAVSDADVQGGRLVRTDDGLFRLGPRDDVSRVEAQSGRVSIISSADGQRERLFATDNRLFRLGPDGPPREVQPIGVPNIGPIREVSDADRGGNRIVRASTGLYPRSERSA